MDRYRMLPSYHYYDVEGNSPLTLDKSVGKPLRDYKIYGNSVQDGTPTPDNPVEVESVGDLILDETDPHFGKYKIPIEVGGKNLFDVESALLYAEEITDYKYANFKFENGKTYTISCFSNVAYTDCWFRVGDTNWSNTYARIKLDSIGEKSITFTVPNDDNEYLIRLYNNGSPNKTQYIKFFNGTYLNNFQIEYGNGTEYEPYRKNITNIYLDEPLKNGEYIDFINQRLVKSDTEQPIDLPPILIHKGTNVISVGTTIPPSNMEIQYYK